MAEGQEEKRARLQRVAQEKADKEAERAARAMQSAVDKATKEKEKAIRLKAKQDTNSWSSFGILHGKT